MRVWRKEYFDVLANSAEEALAMLRGGRLDHLPPVTSVHGISRGNIAITVQGGMVVDVDGLAEDDYEIVDLDVCADHGDA